MSNTNRANMIYLYLKVHNKTGLKYLGKTTSVDPQSYQGSGTVWKRHIKKHGYDVTTIILLETTNPTQIKQAGLYYSTLWDVCNSEDFANIIPESGDGGAMPWPLESRQKLSNSIKGRQFPDHIKQKFSAAQKKQADHLSKKAKEYLSIPEHYRNRCIQLAANWKIPGRRETMSTKISQLKWCNDGTTNYRKAIIPKEMTPGRLTAITNDTREKLRMQTSSKLWWTNGITCTMSTTCPGEGYIRGRKYPKQ